MSKNSRGRKGKRRRAIPQSAVIPWRRVAGGIEILVITSARRGRWVIPKGLVEPDLSPPESAAKEALEEAGAEGELDSRCVGTYKYRKWGRTCHVEVFSLEVTRLHETWDEDFRKRSWKKPKKAAAMVSHRKLGRILRSFVAELA